MHQTAPRVLLLALAAVLVAGCRGQGVVETKQYIYIDSRECAGAGVVKEDHCSLAVAQAVAIHESTAKTHKRVTDCEKDEGVDRCERGDDGKWRPRPFGYLFAVTTTTTVVDNAPVAQVSTTAVPLYAGKQGAAVYRTADDKVFDPEKPADVVFSRSSERRAEGFPPSRGRRG